MKIIYNNIIPFKGYKAINIFGIIFARSPLSDTDKNHEAIHTAQMKEMLYIFFYIWYIAEYIINIFKYKDLHKAYKNIRFEIEAYNNQNNPFYVNHRKLFAWMR